MARKTLRDVSKDTGFAVSTISGVLNNRSDCYASEAARKRIRDAAERLGYYPNYFGKALRSRQSRLIGLVGHMHVPENQTRQYHGIQTALRKRGYVTVLIDSQDDIERAIREFIGIHVDGMVICHDRDNRRGVEADLGDTPVVVIGPRAVPRLCSLVIDWRVGVNRLAKYLIQLGHRRICFVTRKLDYNRCKCEGYAEAMEEAGLRDEIRVFDSLNQTILGCRDIVLENPGPFRRATAVVTSGDQVAVEVISGLDRLGMAVPQDCSVTGFSDNWSAISASPPLTTGHVPRDELGEIVAKMLLGLMAGKRVRNRTIIPELVIRESTAPPRRLPSAAR
jgi:LacI family transcriptional regulator